MSSSTGKPSSSAHWDISPGSSAARSASGYWDWFIALPLLVFLYTLIEGKEKWYTALIATACTYALVWGLFEYMLETRWPPGILFD